MNNIEQTITDLLEQEYGTVHVPVNGWYRREKRIASTRALGKANASYLDNPSQVNYNMMLNAMLAYQYWTHKTIFDGFNTEADF
tara:strand:- start:2196 stop:2447 length:252 start_codon:yes stop_codon:yes gene_type:complete